MALLVQVIRWEGSSEGWGCLPGGLRICLLRRLGWTWMLGVVGVAKLASSSFQRSPKKLGVKALVLPSLMGVKAPS